MLELTYNHVYDPIMKLSVEFCHRLDISIPCAKKVFKCQRQEKSRQLSTFAEIIISLIRLAGEWSANPKYFTNISYLVFFLQFAFNNAR